MKINLAIVVKVVETSKYRVVTVRANVPWHGNPYEDYTFLDNDREFKIGDEIEISAAHLVVKVLSKEIGCCEFHMSGGSALQSCGGDTANPSTTSEMHGRTDYQSGASSLGRAGRITTKGNQ